VLQVCLSRILHSFHILAFSDEPSKPGTPEITDYDNESVNLKWAKPKSDGGAPIEKYIIEKKDRYNHIEFSVVCQK
jgi:hypothetical protein